MLVVSPKFLKSGDCGYGFEALLEGVLSLHEVLIPELEPRGQLKGRACFVHQISTIINLD